jgi:hypothetical protein
MLEILIDFEFDIYYHQLIIGAKLCKIVMIYFILAQFYYQNYKQHGL